MGARVLGEGFSGPIGPISAGDDHEDHHTGARQARPPGPALAQVAAEALGNRERLQGRNGEGGEGVATSGQGRDHPTGGKDRQDEPR